MGFLKGEVSKLQIRALLPALTSGLLLVKVFLPTHIFTFYTQKKPATFAIKLEGGGGAGGGGALLALP